jgi:hypothetical protein
MILKLEEFLGSSIARMNFDTRYSPHLAGLMQIAVGIQVDFRKGPPFHLVGFDIITLNAQIKGIVKKKGRCISQHTPGPSFGFSPLLCDMIEEAVDVRKRKAK